ncbi:phospholipid scramblase family protein [Dehalococcoidia bacterium]|nr:phospholipid scramblase family protein [Dehalococcoidia bacterium]
MINLSEHQSLVVRQKVEHFEAFTQLETKNRYTVSTPDGDPLLYAYEESGALGRIFLKNHRPLSIHVVDNNNQPVLTANRSFFWFLSHLHVQDGGGRVVGSLRRRFNLLSRRFTIEDPAGTRLAEIRGPLLRPNTFMVYTQEEIGRVTKQWSGIGKEIFTDADTFRLEIDTTKMNQDFGLLMLASALAIDLDFFEK